MDFREGEPGPAHGHSLAEDMEVMGRLLFARRRALMFMAGAGSVAALAACGGDDTVGSSGSDASSTSSGSTTSSTSSSSSSSSTSTSTSSTSGGTSDASCIADPTETNGPYPADGTNMASGSTSNVLTQSGIVRTDIRSSFLGSSTNIAAGVPLEIELQLVDVSNGCAAIEGAAIYVWHCDADGKYSLYSSGVTGESYLRGVQVTDSDGKVTFTTIYPACYSGRWPHIHFEIFTGGLTSASTGRTATLISQLAMPTAANSAVFSGDTRYTASIANYNAISLSSDNVFGDNTSAQIAQMTPTLSGSVSAGYTGTAVIGIAT